jgi:hypothetical protein
MLLVVSSFLLPPTAGEKIIINATSLLGTLFNPQPAHCKKRFAIFPPTAGMLLTKLSLDGKNLIIPGQGEFD